MTALIIWIIGHWFTCAYVGTDRLTGWTRYKGEAIIFISWPIQLGCKLREERKAK